MTIHENNLDHLPDFIRLNEEWITTYFELEDCDRALAKHPESIINDGGFIFSLEAQDQQGENKVVGVCALFNEGEGVYQLARMAVSPLAQGGGIGKTLMTRCLEKLADLSAKRVYLISNTKLESALGLYKKFGFETVNIGPHPQYSRADIEMEYRLA